MPKQRIKPEQILDAAMDLLEEGGAQAVTATAIAGRVGCSVQPIYSTCSSMGGLWEALDSRIAGRVREIVAGKLDPQDPFRSTGRAFAAVAAEHPHLFQAFAAVRRPGVSSLEDLLEAEADPAVARRLAGELGLSLEAARKLHLHMLIYNVGLCSILASCSGEMDAGEVFRQTDSAYEAFAAQAAREG